MQISKGPWPNVIALLVAGWLALPATPVVTWAGASFPPSEASQYLTREQLEAVVKAGMPAPGNGAQLEKSVWVPMRDGVRLSTDIYLPTSAEHPLPDTLPVILVRTPYDKRTWFQGPNAPVHSEIAMFVGQGFVVAVQDTRGRYESDGWHRVSADARKDGYDTLSWIAAQPWSNGRIGTYGCSYLGEVQYMLAAMNHPNHAAMIPQAGGGALGMGGRFFNFGINHGGAQELSTISWFLNGRGARVKPAMPADLTRAQRIELGHFYSLDPILPERDLVELFNTLPLIDIGKRGGLPTSDLEDFISHPPADEYWVERGFLQADDQVHVPTLHIDSWYDKMIGATLFMLELAQRNPDREVADNQFAVISPSTHCLSEELTAPTVIGARNLGDASFDHWRLYVDWFDHWLKGTDNGITDMPHFQGYLMGANQWRSHQRWPIAQTRPTRFYLHSDGGANSRHGDGALSMTKPADQATVQAAGQDADTFHYDPATPVPSLGGSFCCIGDEIPAAGSYDHSEIEQRQDVLVYTSAALDQGLEVTGPMEIVLYVSSDAPDTDFFAKLLDVDTNGAAWNLKESVLRARYRNGFDRPQLMRQGEVYELRFPLHATSNYFAPGHRIRLEVSSSSFPRIGRNLNTGGNNYDETHGQVARNTVHHSAQYPSHVVLPVIAATGVGDRPTAARTADGQYISWREHLIDDVSISGVPISGSDGLSVSDLDLDGHLDIVSVHESDTNYDGIADGYIRASFGTGDPGRWKSITLAEGPPAGAAEDAAIGDLNGDGHPDVVAAAELAHLIYLENPGNSARDKPWKQLIPSITTGRGSFIRVFLADFDGDGRPEIVAANKGDQSGDSETLNTISWFEPGADPLDDTSWVEHELTRVVWPINSQPVDLDGDGDLDVIGGSVAERRIMWFENTSGEAASGENSSSDRISFVEHPIEIVGSYASHVSSADQRPQEHQSHGVTGFNMDFADLNRDGRTDIITNEFFQHLVWLEQPSKFDGQWRLHPIGSFAPDHLVGLAASDIDGDGDLDVMTGAYSRGPRDEDGEVGVNDSLGRLAWFANSGDPEGDWSRHDISRRKRGMFDKFVPLDLDGDGDMDFASTRGNSVPYDGVFWLEQVRTATPVANFARARETDSEEMEVPHATSSNIDMEVLEALNEEFLAGKHGYIDSMMVLHRGKVIFENLYSQNYEERYQEKRRAEKDGLWAEGQYNYYDPAWHPWLRGGPLHSMQSVSKSVTSALIGVAIGQGAIPSVDVDVARYFDHPNPFRGDPRGRAITLRDLLTMSAGIDWNESDYGAQTNDCTVMEGSDDWVQYVLDQGMNETPGVLFNYNSGISVLLDQILFKSTGQHADAYGQQFLFGPLGIEFDWKTTPTGIVDTEGGLYLSPRGLARIGELYANDGVWNGQRILPEGWVESSFAPVMDVGGRSRNGWKYGYQWWLMPDPQRPGRFIPTASGFGGQRLHLLPDDDIIAVFTGWNIYEYPNLSADYVMERLTAAVRTRN